MKTIVKMLRRKASFNPLHFVLLLLTVCFLIAVPQKVWGQIAIPDTSPVTENFDAIGSSPTASLPANWKMSPKATSSPTWNDVGNFIATSFAASSGSPITGGKYNWGKTGGTDRSIGFISSTNYKSVNSIMAWYQNTGSENISSLTVSYDLFQFRINTSFTTVTFYYSTDGSTWTTVAAGDAQAIDSGTSTYEFTNPPNFGRSTDAGSAAFTISGLNIPANGDIYLRWSFKTFNSSANSEGLGLDNVSVTASFCTPIDVTGLGVTAGNGKLDLSWTNPSCYNEILIVATTPNPVTSIPSGDGSAYSASSIYGGGTSGNGLSANEFAVYQSSGSSVTVTGLNNGTKYYFKVFTRSGTNWSSGVSVSGIPVSSFTGDFRSKTNGNWMDNNTWEKFSGGVWLNAASGEYPNTKTSNVTISAGTTVTVNGSGPYAINSLMVQSNGQLYTNDANVNTNTYISIYGNITCDGVIGNDPTYDDIAFNIESSTCTISGSGTFTCSRIRKQWTNTATNLVFNMDITTLWNSFSGTQLYNYSTGIFNITINPGYTFTCTNGGSVAIDGVNGLDAAQRNGTLNVYGTLTVPGTLYLTTNNTSASKPITVNIFNGGVVNTNSIDARASKAATHTLHIYNGGTLNITGTTGWSSFSTTNNAYTLDAGSTVQYSAAGDQTIETGVGDYSNLSCLGGGNKTPNSDLTVDGTLNITTSTLSISGNTLSVNGNVTGIGTITGSSTSNLTIGGTGNSVGTLNFTNGSALLNLLTINRTATSQDAAATLGTDVSVNSLSLLNGILATGMNLLTWNNNGGTLTAPENTYTAGSTNYTKSFIATCDASGTPINASDATTAFQGNVGFRIKNVGMSDTYFPVGPSFITAMTGQPASPNRVMINNQSAAPEDFTVVVNYGDIGYTNGGAGAVRVNRIWYVNSKAAKATMRLFFTKRDWTGWGSDENEVESGFLYSQPALVEKDYSGTPSSFLNLSTAPDITSFTSAAYGYNTEIYAQYSLSHNLSDGIQQFYRFSVINAGNIVLPVNILDFTSAKMKTGIQLQWTASNEVNVESYEIQKSHDGLHFSPFEVVKANNQGSFNHYIKTDYAPFTGNNFYRIKIINKDSVIQYSGTIKISFSNTQNVVISPNPVINKRFNLILNGLPAGSYAVSVYNSLGQIISKTMINKNDNETIQTINLPANVPAGTYYLNIRYGDFNLKKELIVISNM